MLRLQLLLCITCSGSVPPHRQQLRAPLRRNSEPQAQRSVEQRRRTLGASGSAPWACSRGEGIKQRQGAACLPSSKTPAAVLDCGTRCLQAPSSPSLPHRLQLSQVLRQLPAPTSSSLTMVGAAAIARSLPADVSTTALSGLYGFGAGLGSG